MREGFFEKKFCCSTIIFQIFQLLFCQIFASQRVIAEKLCLNFQNPSVILWKNITRTILQIFSLLVYWLLRYLLRENEKVHFEKTARKS